MSNAANSPSNPSPRAVADVAGLAVDDLEPAAAALAGRRVRIVVGAGAVERRVDNVVLLDRRLGAAAGDAVLRHLRAEPRRLGIGEARPAGDSAGRPGR